MVKARGGSQTEYEIGKGKKKISNLHFGTWRIITYAQKHTHTHNHKYMKLKQTK